MPPRATARGGSGAGGSARAGSPARGAARGAGGRGPSAPRGVPQQRGGQPVQRGAAQAADVPSHVRTVAVKRKAFGTSGRKLQILVNAAAVLSVPDITIHHYDVDMPGTEAGAAMNQKIMKVVQEENQAIFTPRGVYDGRKNLYVPARLALGPTDSRTFHISLESATPGQRRAPKQYTVKLALAATLNAAELDRFVHGQQSISNEILTVINALNVALRMYPNQRYPFNARSFFTDRESAPLRNGVEVWRGYFQSLRPTFGRLIINVDISSALMYKRGPLIPVALETMPNSSPQQLVAAMPRPVRQKLSKFLRGVRVEYGKQLRKGSIQGLSDKGADQEMFTNATGQQMSVAQYFQTTFNIRLQYPKVLCVRLGKTALVPMELCSVLPGQVYRKDVPPEIQDAFRDFSTKQPKDRLASIRQGMTEFGYGQSEYVRAFGLSVDQASMPMTIEARVLPAPDLMYGPGSKGGDSKPRLGAWNLIDKKFVKPTVIKQWVMAVFESPNRFRLEAAQAAARALVDNAGRVGMRFDNPIPIIGPCNPQQDVATQLRGLGAKCREQYKEPPNLIVVVLPGVGNQLLYRAVKFFGEVQLGVATQVLVSSKVIKARDQYWANVLLKINAKLGGINHTLKPQPVVSLLGDGVSPIIVMGADTIHPSPGPDQADRPSFTALVSSVNVAGTKYVACENVQQGRVEIIQDLKSMAKELLALALDYMKNADKVKNKPSRLMFFRDGVGEGQFEQVKEEEVKLLREACAEMGLKDMRITFVIVGKRHHIRFFPTNDRDADRSGNLTAGTVVDKDITHPTDHDYYLQSHGGLLGTSRSAHYTVLEDDNHITADQIQALSFALCHVYARSTRSVSIPAPVYYADLVAERAKLHFDPGVSFSDTASMTSGATGGGPGMSMDERVRQFKAALRPLHATQKKLMYFQ